MLAFKSGLAGLVLGIAASMSAGPNGLVRARASESIALALGDSIVPRYAIRTSDSTLASVGGGVVARRCGQGVIYLRMWTLVAPVHQLSADTVNVTIPCPATTPPTGSAAPFVFQGSEDGYLPVFSGGSFV